MKLELAWTRNAHGTGLTASWKMRSTGVDRVAADATAPAGTATRWQPRIIQPKQVAMAA